MSLNELINPKGAGIPIKPLSVNPLLPTDPVNPVAVPATGGTISLELQQSCTLIAIPTQTTANLILTLPAPAAGLRYRFVIAGNLATYTATVTTNGSANLFYGTFLNNNSGTANITSVAGHHNIVFSASTLIGDSVEVASDGTNWYIVRGFSAVAGGLASAA